MQSLLPLLFAIALLPPPIVQESNGTEYAADLQRELQIIRVVWEEWENVLAVPVETVATIQVPAGNNFYRGMGNGASEVEQWRALVASQFPAGQVENALCVIRSESGGNTLAKNPNSNARGIFQIMTSVWGPEFGWEHEDFYVPELNAYAAARIWEGSGWQPWSPRTRRNCGL